MINRRPSLAALLVPLAWGILFRADLAHGELLLDAGFDTDGIAEVDFGTGSDVATAVAVQSDGALVLVGTSREVAGADTLDYVALTRVDGATGALDASFGTDGKISFLPGAGATDGGGAVGRAVAIQPLDQKIVIAGTWQPDPEGAIQVFVARFDTDGEPDDSFGTDGVALLTPAGVTDPVGNALALRSDGSIIVAGAGTADDAGVGFIAGLDSSGNAIPGFTDTVVPNPLAAPDGDGFGFNALAILAGDAILAGGGGGDLTVAAFTSTGALDAGFATGGIASINYFSFDTAAGPIGSDDAVTELLVLADGRILIAGRAVAGATRAILARLTAAGALDPSFGSGGFAPLAEQASNGNPTGLGVRPSGDIVLSGSGFKPVQVSSNGIAQSQLAGNFAFGVNDLRVLAGGDVALAGLRNVDGDDTAAAAARLTASDLADGPDIVPDPFTFVTQTGLETATLVTSNAVTIQGIDEPVPVTISFGGEYSIGCTDTFTVAAGTIGNGQTVCVRTITPDDGESDSRVFLSVGGVLAQFAVITGNAEPNQFSFQDQVGVPALATIYAAAVTITGNSVASPVRISRNGEYQINCAGSFTSEPGVVAPGDTICVRHVSASSLTTETNTVLTVGGVSDTFTSTTTAEATPLPGSSAMDVGSLLLLAPLAAYRRRR